MAWHHAGRLNRTVGVPIPGPRVFELVHLRLRSPFRNAISMEGRGCYARAWRWVKVSASDRSLFENGPAVRALLGALVDVRAAVRAREGGCLAGFLALRRSGRFHLGLRLFLRNLRLAGEYPSTRRALPDRVPPHEQDEVREGERQDHRECGEVDEQAVEVRPRRGQGAEVEVRERPVLVLVPHRESVAVDLVR